MEFYYESYRSLDRDLMDMRVPEMLAVWINRSAAHWETRSLAPAVFDGRLPNKSGLLVEVTFLDLLWALFHLGQCPSFAIMK